MIRLSVRNLFQSMTTSGDDFAFEYTTSSNIWNHSLSSPRHLELESDRKIGEYCDTSSDKKVSGYRSRHSLHDKSAKDSSTVKLFQNECKFNSIGRTFPLPINYPEESVRYKDEFRAKEDQEIQVELENKTIEMFRRIKGFESSSDIQRSYDVEDLSRLIESPEASSDSHTIMDSMFHIEI